MAEELYFSIKTDTKAATKDTKEYGDTLQSVNSTLKEQREILTFLQKEQIKLEQAQAKMSDWEKHISGSTGKIKDLKLEIKDQRVAVQTLTTKQKELTKAQKENADSLLNDIKNYKVFGISINGISKGFKKLVPVARAAFASIKAGMISTGIGALIVAFGSLVAWFTKTKAGAEALSKIFTVVGTAVKVFIDRLISYGKLLASIITLDFKGMASNAKAAFSGIGDELSREIKLAMELSKATYALADSERAVSVETAKRRAEIEELKVKSHDLNLTEEERLQALEKAGAIESQIMAARVANAEESVRIQQQQMTMSDNMAADLDTLAEKEIKLADIRRESSRMQKTITTRANRIRRQVAAQEAAAHKVWVSRQNEKIKKQNDTVTKFNKLRQDEQLKSMSNDRARANAENNRLRDSRLKELEETVFEKEKFDELEIAAFTAHGVEKARIKKRFDKKAIEVANKKATDLLAIENETMLLGIKNERDRAEESLKIQEELELKSVEGRKDTAELQSSIEDKYIALRKEKKDLEAEQDIERDKEVTAAKAQILADTLAVGQKFMDLQAANLESNYKKEIKLAKANGKSTEGIEEKYAGKRREQAKKFKAMKIAMAIVDTYQAATAAYASALNIPGAGIALAPIAAGLAVAAGLANIAMIEKQPLGGGGGGAGGGGGPAPAAGAQPPSGGMMSGSFELGGGVEPDPLRAYVLTDEMSNSQNQLANIRRRSTI